MSTTSPSVSSTWKSTVKYQEVDIIRETTVITKKTTVTRYYDRNNQYITTGTTTTQDRNVNTACNTSTNRPFVPISNTVPLKKLSPVSPVVTGKRKRDETSDEKNSDAVDMKDVEESQPSPSPSPSPPKPTAEELAPLREKLMKLNSMQLSQVFDLLGPECVTTDDDMQAVLLIQDYDTYNKVKAKIASFNPDVLRVTKKAKPNPSDDVVADLLMSLSNVGSPTLPVRSSADGRLLNDPNKNGIIYDHIHANCTVCENGSYVPPSKVRCSGQDRLRYFLHKGEDGDYFDWCDSEITLKLFHYLLNKFLRSRGYRGIKSLSKDIYEVPMKEFGVRVIKDTFSDRTLLLGLEEMEDL
jgi:hypothetical protein